MAKKKSVNRWKKLLVAGLALAAAGGLVANYFIYKGERVVEIVDGDTFIIANRQLVRLYGIDAPELGRCGSLESKKYLSSLILNKNVIITDLRGGGYNRVMGFVYVAGTSVDAAMMKAGMGVLIRGATELPALAGADAYARSHKLGVFSPACSQTVNTAHPDCSIKGNINVDNAKSYFLPSCTNYDQTIVSLSYGDQWFCTESEAQKTGFTKSIKCQ